MARPLITKGKTGIGNFGVGVMPDGTANTLRILIKPDGFHFEASDFEDVVLPDISFASSNGTEYKLSFDDTGTLLINGNQLTVPTNQLDETIGGDKTHTGLTILKGGLRLLSPNGQPFNISVSDDGTITAKEVSNATGN